MKKNERTVPIKRCGPPKKEPRARFVEVSYKQSTPTGKPVKVMTRRTLQGVRKV